MASKKIITIDQDLGKGGAGLDDSVSTSKVRQALQDIIYNQNRLTLLQFKERSQAANSGGTDVLAETTIGFVLAAGDLKPFVGVEGAVTANDTTYATLTFRVYRGGSVVQTWTYTTQTVSGGGIGSLTTNQLFEGTTTFAAQKGDKVTVQEAKASTGVILPARIHGFEVL